MPSAKYPVPTIYTRTLAHTHKVLFLATKTTQYIELELEPEPKAEPEPKQKALKVKTKLYQCLKILPHYPPLPSTTTRDS